MDIFADKRTAIHKSSILVCLLEFDTGSTSYVVLSLVVGTESELLQINLVCVCAQKKRSFNEHIN